MMYLPFNILEIIMNNSTKTQSTSFLDVKPGMQILSKLYGGRYGVITAVHGQQNPNGVRHLMGGMIGTGGSATIDIAFENGDISYAIPECIFRGVQWELFPEQPFKDVQEAIAKAEAIQALKKAKAEAAQKAFEVAKQKLIDENPYELEVVGSYASTKLVAANVRKVLKKDFPGIKFSVKSSSHGSIGVSWVDGPVSIDVDMSIERFKAGNFNGMEDIYEYSKSTWGEAFGSVEYLFTNREESQEATQKAIDFLWLIMEDGELDGIEKPTPETVHHGYLNIEHLNCTLSQAVHYLSHAYDHIENKFKAHGYPTFVVRKAINYVLRQEFMSMQAVQELSLSDLEKRQLFWKVSDLVEYQNMTLEQAVIQVIAA
jgi:hypothetical protein